MILDVEIRGVRDKSYGSVIEMTRTNSSDYPVRYQMRKLVYDPYKGIPLDKIYPGAVKWVWQYQDFKSNTAK